MRLLILRFDAPLMSFGTIMVDHHGHSQKFPGLSMLTGLIANALGWHHRDFNALQSLQDRIIFAARWDKEPQYIMDYQTVQLGQSKMSQPGWTTRGEPEYRGGGSKTGTHIRYRYYWADGIMTLALGLEPEQADPNIERIAQALKKPSRPLFIGRKSCLPAAPILLETWEADDPLSALKQYPAVQGQEWLACWSTRIQKTEHAHHTTHYDRREWANQIHAGISHYQEGILKGKDA